MIISVLCIVKNIQVRDKMKVEIEELNKKIDDLDNANSEILFKQIALESRIKKIETFLRIDHEKI
jgi:hypothetical protein